jgi:hypothetical protein
MRTGSSYSVVTKIKFELELKETQRPSRKKNGRSQPDRYCPPMCKIGYSFLPDNKHIVPTFFFTIRRDTYQHVNI